MITSYASSAQNAFKLVNCSAVTQTPNPKPQTLNPKPCSSSTEDAFRLVHCFAVLRLYIKLHGPNAKTWPMRGRVPAGMSVAFYEDLSEHFSLADAKGENQPLGPPPPLHLPNALFPPSFRVFELATPKSVGMGTLNPKSQSFLVGHAQKCWNGHPDMPHSTRDKKISPCHFEHLSCVLALLRASKWAHRLVCCVLSADSGLHLSTPFSSICSCVCLFVCLFVFPLLSLLSAHVCLCVRACVCACVRAVAQFP